MAVNEGRERKILTPQRTNQMAGIVTVSCRKNKNKVYFFDNIRVHDIARQNTAKVISVKVCSFDRLPAPVGTCDIK